MADDKYYSGTYEEYVAYIIQLYSSIQYQPPPGQYTVAASFFLTSSSAKSIKIVSLTTGTKCLPTSRFPERGEALHDSHAEILARRGAVRWLLEEIRRCQLSADSYSSLWICSRADGYYDFRDDVQAYLYISTPPCGDASTRYLASMQDAEVTELKNSSVYPTLHPTQPSRGRNDYTRLGVLRTKPGRADSPATNCMSCSDKIASWSVLGFQGALASCFLRPVYLSTIIIGDVPSKLSHMLKEDCERALSMRLKDSHPNFTVHSPDIKFTSHSFPHSRANVISEAGIDKHPSNESLCWIADTASYEILINGTKRGVPPKHQLRVESIPRLSKALMFELYIDIMKLLCRPWTSTSYHQAKHSVLGYQKTKNRLMGKEGPFSGWVKSGVCGENFRSLTSNS